MKILLAAVVYEDSFADNVEVTLRMMGHDVATLGHVSHATHWSWQRRGLRALGERLAGNRPTREERRLLTLARSFRPDLFLALTRGVHQEVLEQIGPQCPGRRVLWWGDAPANSQRWSLLSPGWDAIYVKDADAASKLRLVGANAHVLHEAMNPIWHRRVAARKNDAVAVVGNSYAFRQAVCLRLMKAGVPLTIHGSPPPAWSNPAYRRAHSGRYLVKEEKSRVFGEALACLNTFSLSEGNSLNCRAFEIAGAAGLQLIEHRPAIEECFEPGRELLAFRTWEELLEQIQRATADRGSMAALREAASKRALGEHTYRHRLDAILRNL